LEVSYLQEAVAESDVKIAERDLALAGREEVNLSRKY